MQMVKRAASVTRTAASNYAANAQARRPVQLSNSSSGGGGGSTTIIIILALVIVGVGGFFALKKLFPSKPKVQEVIDLPVIKELPSDGGKKKEEPKKVEEPPVVEEKKVSKQELLKKKYDETMASRKEAYGKIAQARDEEGSKALPGLKGIKFGEVEKGVPSVWGPILPGDSIEKCGVTYAVYGKAVSKPLGTLGKTPLIWVTPKTKRVFRIEFFRPLKKDKKTGHDPETASLSAMMAKILKRDPIVTHNSEPGLPGVEYVFPSAQTTVKVGEYGDMLKVFVEHEGLRVEAKNESDVFRAEMVADVSQDKLLESTRYPQGEFGKYRGVKVRFAKGTPTSFCGVTFGKTAPEWAAKVYPKNGEKMFYLNYTRAKCKAFKGFDVGKAKVDPYRGGVYEVTLYNSQDGLEGLDDESYYKSIRGALDRHYGVKPVEKPGKGKYPELVYTIGDVSVVFGPDLNGGFRLGAVNKVLAEIAKTKPHLKATR
jgi:hypothetical protein